jgi:hypothetical protein
MTATPPPDADLGDCECECRAVNSKDKSNIMWAVVGGLLAAAFLAYLVLFQTFPIRPNHWREALVADGLAFALMAWPFLYALIKWRRGIVKEVVVYANGVTCTARGQTLLCRWRDVVSIKHDRGATQGSFLNVHTQRYVTLADTAGTVIHFVGPQQEVGFVADAVVRRAYGVLMPRALRRLADGKSVAVGPITVSAAGLKTKEGKLPWDEVGSVSVEQGYLVIRALGRKREWFKQLVGSVENHRVLLALWDERRPEDAGTGPARRGGPGTRPPEVDR